MTDMLARYKAAEQLVPWNTKHAVLNGKPTAKPLDDTHFFWAEEVRDGEDAVGRVLGGADRSGVGHLGLGRGRVIARLLLEGDRDVRRAFSHRLGLLSDRLSYALACHEATPYSLCHCSNMPMLPDFDTVFRQFGILQTNAKQYAPYVVALPRYLRCLA